jgi:peptidoglycan/xylan/chitin deacetylase (PgdA/CDA1 family)
MKKINGFIRKFHWWRKLNAVEFTGPYFALTGDIDSTKPMETKIIHESLNIAKKHEVPYLLFVTPTPENNLKFLINQLKKWNGNIILGVHGYNHISFDNLSFDDQTIRWTNAKNVFLEQLSFIPGASRTPFLSLNKHSYKSIDYMLFKHDFSTCFGWKSTYNNLFLKPRKLKYTIFNPITLPTDIFFQNEYSSEEMAQAWIKIAESIAKKKGLISVLAHPNNPQVPKALDKLLGYIRSQEIPLWRM